MQNQLKEDLNDFLKEKEELREVIGKLEEAIILKLK